MTCAARGAHGATEETTLAPRGMHRTEGPQETVLIIQRSPGEIEEEGKSRAQSMDCLSCGVEEKLYMVFMSARGIALLPPARYTFALFLSLNSHVVVASKCVSI